MENVIILLKIAIIAFINRLKLTVCDNQVVQQTVWWAAACRVGSTVSDSEVI